MKKLQYNIDKVYLIYSGIKNVSIYMHVYKAGYGLITA